MYHTYGTPNSIFAYPNEVKSAMNPVKLDSIVMLALVAKYESIVAEDRAEQNALAQKFLAEDKTEEITLENATPVMRLKIRSYIHAWETIREIESQYIVSYDKTPEKIGFVPRRDRATIEAIDTARNKESEAIYKKTAERLNNLYQFAMNLRKDTLNKALTLKTPAMKRTLAALKKI